MKPVLLLILLCSLTIADDRFLPEDWFAGVIKNTPPESIVSLYILNKNIIGISTQKGKCHLIFYSKKKPKNIKILYVSEGLEYNAIGEEKAIEYRFEKDEKIFNFLLGFEIEFPLEAQKVIFSLQFDENEEAFRIEANLDGEGEVASTEIKSVDARQEFEDN